MPAQSPPLPTVSGRALGLLAAAWFLAYFGARALLEQPELARAARLGAALLPLPLFAAFLFRFIRAIRGADELERRIHLEALAVAFPLTILLLQTLGLVERAVGLKFEDWSYAHVWAYATGLYFLGLALARRRYA
ncbi:MAG TPA: hypothetical protein VJ773_05455 [Gemmatimonadales bacterium]|nr:hypothetical protein [Gemmatimonadales bacterium]